MTLDDQSSKRLRILAVDDEQANLLLLRRILEVDGYTQVATTTDPERVPAMFLEAGPDLLLLDLRMPGMDGFELMERIAPLTGNGNRIPILVMTADTTDETKRRALAAGARDFLVKPVDRIELLLRVRNLLQVQQLQLQLRDQNSLLESQVAQRTRALDRARLEILERLALAAEYRDDETQEHAWRIGRTCGLLARGMDLPEAEVEVLQRAAPLHDIGKIGIPDAILLKPRRLTDDEFDHVKTHTTIGAKILSGSSSPLLRLAEEIAVTHHERWDGRGYPHGLVAGEIPLAGRIVAVADVFDALTHERPYKKAWPIDDAVAEILEQTARQFDPEVVEAFSKLDHPTLLSRIRTRASPAESLIPLPQAVLGSH